eukprot:Amastigsp_a1437_414.p3 type:complete len:150 gc:universal Amastigsp_a1437_414:560-111(-)
MSPSMISLMTPRMAFLMLSRWPRSTAKSESSAKTAWSEPTEPRGVSGERANRASVPLGVRASTAAAPRGSASRSAGVSWTALACSRRTMWSTRRTMHPADSSIGCAFSKRLPMSRKHSIKSFVVVHLYCETTLRSKCRVSFATLKDPRS